MEEKIRQYLIDFQKRRFEVFERDLKVRPTKEFITTVIGARRVGKTYFLYSQINKIKDRKKVVYADFEAPQFLDFDGVNLKELINLQVHLFGEPEYFFFDEIQALKNWQIGLRDIYERKKYYIFISGSSSKLLSQELATQLRGRALSYSLYPYSFKEIVRLKNLKFSDKASTEEKNRIIFEFNKYLKLGGYPQIVKEPQLKDQIVADYKDIVLFRDLVDRHELKNIYLARLFFEYLINSFTKLISLDKFYSYLKSRQIAVSKKTLYSYLGYFEDSLFFHPLRSYKIRQNLKKVYLNDVVFGAEEKGKRLENLVALELLRRKAKMFFYGDKGECDFVLDRKQAVQVCWEIGGENEKREKEGLIEAMEYFRVKKGLILSYNQKETTVYKGCKIVILPVWEWLLK